MKTLILAACCYGTLYSSAVPPERFQGPAIVTMVTLPSAEISAVCAKMVGRKPPEGMVFSACARRGIMYLPNPCESAQQERFAKLTCHEIGHATYRWPADHPE